MKKILITAGGLLLACSATIASADSAQNSALANLTNKTFASAGQVPAPNPHARPQVQLASYDMQPLVALLNTKEIKIVNDGVTLKLEGKLSADSQLMLQGEAANDSGVNFVNYIRADVGLGKIAKAITTDNSSVTDKFAAFNFRTTADGQKQLPQFFVLAGDKDVIAIDTKNLEIRPDNKFVVTGVLNTRLSNIQSKPETTLHFRNSIIGILPTTVSATSVNNTGEIESQYLTKYGHKGAKANIVDIIGENEDTTTGSGTTSSFRLTFNNIKK
jgi:hypothetical protein